MHPASHLAHLRAEGARLVEAAAAGRGDEPVPDCPGWSLDDLVRHLGVVHRWSGEALGGAGERPARDSKSRLEASAPTGHEALVAWYAESLGDLLDDLDRALDAGAPSWSFLPGSDGAAFWARRQAHETAIHRVDAERAVGVVSGLDTGLAHDGVDEVLTIAAAGLRTLVTEPALTVLVHSVDTNGRWSLHVEESSRELRVLDGTEDAPVGRTTTVSGAATGLYLALWNRLDPRVSDRCVTVTGDEAFVPLWREHATIR